MKKFIALLFLSFFSCNFAFAEALTLTHRGSIIPGGNNNFIGGIDHECRNAAGSLVDVDSSQDPYDVTFSPDGTQVFIANRANSNTTSDSPLRMNRVDIPFDITSDRIKGYVNADCNDLAGANPNDLAGGDMTFLTVDHIEKLHISPDGRIFFILNTIISKKAFSATEYCEYDSNSNLKIEDIVRLEKCQTYESFYKLSQQVKKKLVEESSNFINYFQFPQRIAEFLYSDHDLQLLIKENLTTSPEIAKNYLSIFINSYHFNNQRKIIPITSFMKNLYIII